MQGASADLLFNRKGRCPLGERQLFNLRAFQPESPVLAIAERHDPFRVAASAILNDAVVAFFPIGNMCRPVGERNGHEWRRAGDAKWRRNVKRDPSSLTVILIGLAMGGAIAAGIIAWPQVESSVAAVPHGDRIRVGSCHLGGGINCVVDGDTFWMNGQKIRVADIDAPDTSVALCL